MIPWSQLDEHNVIYQSNVFLLMTMLCFSAIFFHGKVMTDCVKRLTQVRKSTRYIYGIIDMVSYFLRCRD